MKRAWTARELRILRKHYPHERAAETAVRLKRPVGQVYQAAQRYGLCKSAAFMASDRSGRVRRGKQDPRMIASQFRAGHSAWNKGHKGWQAGGRSVETQFQRGQLSGRAAKLVQPIGAQRIDKGGILQRKVSNEMPFQRRWQSVHSLVWQAAHGPIPRGCIVVFKAGKHTTVAAEITVDKLECITRRENMRRNSRYTRYGPALNQLMQLRGALKRKIRNAEERINV